MLQHGIARLRPETRLARIGHEVHAHRLASLRIDIRQTTQLQSELRMRIRHVFQVRRHAWTPENRNGRVSAVKSVIRAGIAARGIADHFNRKLGLPFFRRPWNRQPDQPTIQQQGVRALLLLRKIGTIRSVHRGKQRILSLSGVPSLANRRGRNSHRIRRLMTSDASAPVGAQRFKKWMSLGVHRAGCIDNAQPPKSIVELKLRAKHAAGLPGSIQRYFDAA